MLIVLNTETQSKDIVGMLNKVMHVQMCDATGDEENYCSWDHKNYRSFDTIPSFKEYFSPLSLQTANPSLSNVSL